MKHTEIKCPYCRIGFGGIKVTPVTTVIGKSEKEIDKKTFFGLSKKKVLVSEDITSESNEFYHLDICWSSDAGLIKTCENQELLQANLISIDYNGNPIFNESFTHKLDELKHGFVTNPIDISKENFTEEAYIIAFRECMEYGEVDLDDEEYDRSILTIEKVKELYDAGSNLKDALKYFIVKIKN